MQAKDHVLISAGRLGLGGVMTHLRLLCLELHRASVKVTIFASASLWPASILAELRAIGVKIILPPRALWSWPRLANLYSMGIWRFCFPKEASSLYCIGAGHSHLYLHSLGKPGIVSIYHELVAPSSPSSLAGRCIEHLDTSVANSTAVAEIMSSFFPNKPLRVIPFLTPAVVPADRSRTIANGQLRVVYLGRLVNQKRPDRLVREWPVICMEASLGPARLDVYGHDPDGGMLSELREVVAQNRLERSVVLHGAYQIEQLPEILAASDVVVLPSLWEGLPLVLVEAMRSGVPIVACAAGGTAELAVDNPDVIVTSTEWTDFVEGLKRMAAMIREDRIDPARLASWTERRYGSQHVSQLWSEALLQPKRFFDMY